MDLALADKRALVTGSTGGIGEGIVPVENSARVRNRFPDRAQFRRMHASSRPRSRRADVHSPTA